MAGPRDSNKKPKRGFSLLFIGPSFKTPRNVKPAFHELRLQLKATWHDDSAGLLRILRLFLIIIQFGNPFMIVNHLLSRISYKSGMLFVDVFVLLKLLFPTFLLLFIPQAQLWARIICIYFIVDTLLCLYGIVLIPDPVSKAISRARSFLLMTIDYFVIAVSFAVLYLGQRAIFEIDSPIKALYFSFVTSATVGFGDIVPRCPRAYRLVIFQIISSISFLTVFFAYFLPGVMPSRRKR